MISKFRKGADSLLVRILLGLIALSFVGVGGAAFINGNSSGDVVSFSDADSISFEEFHAAKAKEVDFLQRQNGINLTEENIAELGIDNSVLKKLINDSMIEYLAKYYEFDISDEKVIAYVKKTPFFKNSKGEFDLSVFKAAFNNSLAKEEEYLASVKHHLITSTMLGTFMDAFNPPKMMTENIVNYMSETRVVDVLSVDLEFKPNGYKPNDISNEQLLQFYQENKSLFVIPELRSFEYVKADRKFLEKKLNISDKDIRNYFEEYKDEFESKKFSEVKDQVREAFSSEKITELSNELAKNFEEDVSSGLTLTEIANKYDLQIISGNDINFSDMSASSQADYIELADSVFEMAEGEVSYPIEVQDTSEILLVSLKSVTQTREQGFEEVEKNIKDTIEKRDLAIANMKSLKEEINGFNLSKIDKSILSSKGISIVQNLSFTRADLPIENKLPADLLKEIFTIKLNNATNIINADNKAYFAYLKGVNSSKIMADKIRKNAGDHFSNVIKEGVFQELVGYLTQKNNMKIKANFAEN